MVIESCMIFFVSLHSSKFIAHVAMSMGFRGWGAAQTHLDGFQGVGVVR